MADLEWFVLDKLAHSWVHIFELCGANPQKPRYTGRVLGGITLLVKNKTVLPSNMTFQSLALAIRALGLQGGGPRWEGAWEGRVG